MRIVSMTVVFAAVLLAVSVQEASADTANTNINTEISNNNTTSYSFSNDPFLLAFAFDKPVIEKKVEKTPEEIRYEAVLEKWKLKQSHLWKNLPQGKFTINASAYTAAADECGKSDGITASGIKVQEKRTLACPPAYPFGAKINIEGFGVFTCEDRGGAIKGNHFDIYMQTKKEAFQFGRRNIVAEVVQ